MIFKIELNRRISEQGQKSIKNFIRFKTFVLTFGLKGNPMVTNDSAKYLTCYKKIEYMDLSGTGFQVRVIRERVQLQRY